MAQSVTALDFLQEGWGFNLQRCQAATIELLTKAFICSNLISSRGAVFLLTMCSDPSFLTGNCQKNNNNNNFHCAVRYTVSKKLYDMAERQLKRFQKQNFYGVTLWKSVGFKKPLKPFSPNSTPHVRISIETA